MGDLWDYIKCPCCNKTVSEGEWEQGPPEEIGVESDEAWVYRCPKCGAVVADDGAVIER